MRRTGGRLASNAALAVGRGAASRAASCLPTNIGGAAAPASATVRSSSLSCTARGSARNANHRYASTAAAAAPLSAHRSTAARRNFSSLQMPPRLAHEWIVDGKVVPSSRMEGRAVSRDNEVIVFLHGLLGNAKNLRSPAKKLTQHLPHMTALLLDIRGHGNSASVDSPFAQPHNFRSCVEDVFHTLSDLGLTGSNSPAAVCGHSLGGRIALQYSHSLRSTPQLPLMGGTNGVIEPPKQTWVLDTVPGRVDPSVHHILKTIASVPTPIPSKAWLIEALTTEHKLSKGVALWIASNVRERGDQSFDWIFDLSIANELVANFAEQNLIEMIHDVTTSQDDTNDHTSMVQLVMAGRNTNWSEEMVEELRSLPAAGRTPPSFHMHTLDKAGHWVHVDDLEGLVKLMVTGLQ